MDTGASKLGRDADFPVDVVVGLSLSLSLSLPPADLPFLGLPLPPNDFLNHLLALLMVPF